MPQKTFHVALILSLNKRFDRKVGEGIGRFIHESGRWSVFIEDDPAAKIPDFNRGRFNGVIADLDDPRIPVKIADLNIPVVGIGSIDPKSSLNLSVPTVGTDNRAIARMAAQYLVRIGARSFGYCGISSKTIDIWNKERQQGFVEQLRDAGFGCSVFRGQHSASHSWERLQKALYEWLANLTKPAGILAANDVRARHVLEACRCYGLRVPDEVSVLGVDNDTLICELAAPTLSSIIQGTEEMGYRAAKMLDSLMRHPRRSRRLPNILVAPVSLLERASTDLVATSDYIVRQAIEYIRQHACDGIGVDQVATGINVSRSTLDTRFRQTTGRSVHAEIQRIQMNTACHLLTASDLPISKIARRTGFCHAQYFTSAFKRHYRMTPAVFRARTR